MYTIFQYFIWYIIYTCSFPMDKSLNNFCYLRRCNLVKFKFGQDSLNIGSWSFITASILLAIFSPVEIKVIIKDICYFSLICLISVISNNLVYTTSLIILSFVFLQDLPSVLH